MARALKAYTWNADGRVRCLIATTSLKRAAELAHTSVSHIRGYGGQTDKREWVEIAEARPETPLYVGLNLWNGQDMKAENFRTDRQEAHAHQQRLREAKSDTFRFPRSS